MTPEALLREAHRETLLVFADVGGDTSAQYAARAAADYMLESALSTLRRLATHATDAPVPRTYTQAELNEACQLAVERTIQNVQEGRIPDAPVPPAGEMTAAANAFARGEISSGKLAEVLGCDDKHGFKTMAHAWCDLEPKPAPEQGEDADVVNRVTAAVREADRTFEKVGGSSRHWVRDCFLPTLNRHGLVVALPAPAPQGEARDTPPTADREALARRVEQLVAGLVDQQAMPDGWWKPELAAVVAALRQEPKP